jgi:hypothetical protein
MFQTLGAAIAVLGGLVKFGGKDTVDTVLGTIVDTVGGMVGGTGDFDLSSLDLASTLGGAAVTLMIVGVALAIIAALGMFGAKMKIGPALLTVSRRVLWFI